MGQTAENWFKLKCVYLETSRVVKSAMIFKYFQKSLLEQEKCEILGKFKLFEEYLNFRHGSKLEFNVHTRYMFKNNERSSILSST